MKSNRLSVLMLGVIVLMGCRANEGSLSDYIKTVELQAKSEVATLQPVMDFNVSLYAQTDKREPFVLPVEALVQDQPVAKKDCWQPSRRNKSGKLERYPLSKLRLKGVMGSGGKVSALVQTPAGNVVNVRAGQFIGLNNGKVTQVTDRYLLINETLPDGLGCWNKRNVKLALK